MLQSCRSSINRTTLTRGFRTLSPQLFKKGDTIPTGLPGLKENSPGNSVDLGKEVAKGKYIIVGVPAAFSPACSASHVPGYIEHLPQLKEKGVKQVLITAVNDPFVTAAWGKSLHVPSDVRIIADTEGAFAKAGDHLFDSTKVFGNKRSIRYAAVVQDGQVVEEFAEPDKTGVDVSSAESVLRHL